MSDRYFERSWQIESEFGEFVKQMHERNMKFLQDMSKMEKEQRRVHENMKRQIEELERRGPIDFASFGYSKDKLFASVKKLRYSVELEKFVEEKLGVTRPGECEAKINAMSTEQFIRFYKQVDEEWEARLRMQSDGRSDDVEEPEDVSR